jgi:hypothetical protein
LNSSALLRWLLSFGAIELIFWTASRKTLFADTISSVFLSVALFSIFLILVRTRFSWRELGAVVIVSGLLYLLDIRILGYKFSWPVLVSCVGVAGLVLLALRAIWATATERRAAWLTFSAAFLFVASEWCASYFLEWGERVRPMTLDLFLYSFDVSLGVQPAIVLGRMFLRFPAFALVSQLFYLALPVAIGLAFAGCVVEVPEDALPAAVAFLITGPIGACFYAIFPALGPVHILRTDFPWHALTMAQARRLLLEPIAMPGARNAIPSLHAAWIFLVYWYSRRLSLVERIGAAVFVFFTLCATLGTGEHYMVDLVVAVPFTLMIVVLTQAICIKYLPVPWAAFLYGLMATLLWFALLRYGNHFFWASPMVPWMACVFTVALAWYFARGLARGLESAKSTRGVAPRDAKLSEAGTNS